MITGSVYSISIIGRLSVASVNGQLTYNSLSGSVPIAGVVAQYKLLMEDGFYLLLEDGSYLIL